MATDLDMGLDGQADAVCDLCHGTREVRDGVGIKVYPETAPCPKCSDGTWALIALRKKSAALSDALVEIQVLSKAIAIGSMTAASTTPPILPCPFCGSDAAFDQMEMQIQCRKPACTGQSWLFDTLDEAVAAWNTRTTPAKAPSRA